ncbi:MAG: pantoate--beta-alanine ligase [Candidatus Andeanibacterium colombiense]|uniref:Pantothenate synthetase n=1 Tax=Candidatus Andeanibacterium colombiense TaxID=3121345 RepID=A0AAJ5X4S9_9SPHN|nr:MAG: pantoate--beta-alanine ligase [Sphingomonadaceae bacterium]
MEIVTTLPELRDAIAALRRTGPVALVPTMGALHGGHLALVRRAAELAPNVVVSIFVNPTQFGPNEDLAKYPRQPATDIALLEAEGAALLWAPAVDEVYPEGFATSISVEGVSEGLDGTWRPGHFAGVATVVAKLFNQVQPDIAVFGEKDWQQLAVIRRMARDLDLTHPAAAQIVGVETVREADGLAMSSRNRYLSPEDRAAAAALPRAMKAAIEAIEEGAEVVTMLEKLEVDLIDAGFASIDYATLADAASLVLLTEAHDDRPMRLLVAARIGGTRLIDNMAVEARA